jgi:hypothetical protein
VQFPQPKPLDMEIRLKTEINKKRIINYFGDYEEEIDNVGNIRKIHYLRGAVYIDNSIGADEFYYTYTELFGFFDSTCK